MIAGPPSVFQAQRRADRAGQGALSRPVAPQRNPNAAGCLTAAAAQG